MSLLFRRERLAFLSPALLFLILSIVMQHMSLWLPNGRVGPFPACLLINHLTFILGCLLMQIHDCACVRTSLTCARLRWIMHMTDAFALIIKKVYVCLQTLHSSFIKLAEFYFTLDNTFCGGIEYINLLFNSNSFAWKIFVVSPKLLSVTLLLCRSGWGKAGGYLGYSGWGEPSSPAQWSALCRGGSQQAQRSLSSHCKIWFGSFQQPLQYNNEKLELPACRSS